MSAGQPLLQEEENSEHTKYLAFMLGKEVYEIEIRFVTEIIGLQKISCIPQAPDYMKGIINLRGKIIPVIDMRLRLNMPPAAYTDRTCIIVIDAENSPIGLIVDSVDEVESISRKMIEPPPLCSSESSNRFIKGIGKSKDQIRFILDCSSLFMNDEVNARM